MKRYAYKVEFENKGLKTKFFDTRKQMLCFINKSKHEILGVFEKGMLGYISIANFK